MRSDTMTDDEYERIDAAVEHNRRCERCGELVPDDCDCAGRCDGCDEFNCICGEHDDA
jgi:hypothetical protein